MSSEWISTTVGEICTKVFSGGTPTSTNSAYYDGGTIPWLRTKEVNYGRIYSTEEHITELGFYNSSVKLVPVNSVIVAMYGNGDTAGRVAINKVPLTTNQACCNLVVDESQADYRFVYYYLMGQYKALVDLKNGGAQQNLNSQLIKAFPIMLPSVADQVEISTLMESLDDRIALLRETNATLEAIAQALFKSWFVDFDPVRAKMEGRAPEGMDEATAALFPDSFEESALGLVPKGWRVGTVEDICDFIANGGTPSRAKAEFWIDGSMPWFKTGDFSDGFLLAPVERITETAIAKSSVKVLPADAILMAIYAAPTVGRLGVLTEPATFNQACTGMVAKNSVGPWFLFLTLFFGRVWFNSRANGAAQQNISKAIVSSYKIVVPPPAVLAEFHQLAERLYRRIRACSEQAQTLATLRDTLLPRLISGQLRLPEAGALLEETCA